MESSRTLLSTALGFLVAGSLAAASAAAPQPLPDSSLYQLHSSWMTDRGGVVRLESLRGKPRLLTLFFSRCESVCPMLLGQLKSLESELPESLRRDIGFVAVTFDVQRDSVAALRDFRSRMGFSEERWQILRGNADDTRELALLLGVEYQPGGRGQIDHNGLIALLDREGRVVKKVSGIEDRPAFIAEMRKLIESGGMSGKEGSR